MESLRYMGRSRDFGLVGSSRKWIAEPSWTVLGIMFDEGATNAILDILPRQHAKDPNYRVCGLGFRAEFKAIPPVWLGLAIAYWSSAAAGAVLGI
jgi:hypothetical protein